MRQKKRGQIRACGFSTHKNQAQVIRMANRNLFYDVIMVAFNHCGSYRHAQTGFFDAWDQKGLIGELESVKKNGMGIIAMKTCSGGPYSSNPETPSSFKAALQWVLKHDYIHSMAVAISNLDQLYENVSAISTVPTF